MSHLQWDNLSVVGTTTPVKQDDLPARLAPLYRDATGHYYLPIDGETPGDVSVDEVEEPWVNLQRDVGDIVLFGAPFPARSMHVLLQTDASAPPEYFPEDDLRRRLAELGQKALRDAGRALLAGDRATAEEHTWYAARAVPREALPLLVLRALLRGQIPPDHLAFLERDIGALSEEQRLGALDVKGDELTSLVDLVRSDMVPRHAVRFTESKPRAHRPVYLELLDDVPTFLSQARRWLAPSNKLQPA